MWFCGSRKDVIRILQMMRPHLDVKTHEANLALDYLLPATLAENQQERIYRAMRMAKVKGRKVVRNQWGTYATAAFAGSLD